MIPISRNKKKTKQASEQTENLLLAMCYKEKTLYKCIFQNIMVEVRRESTKNCLKNAMMKPNSLCANKNKIKIISTVGKDF